MIIVVRVGNVGSGRGGRWKVEDQGHLSLEHMHVESKAFESMDVMETR